MSIFTVALNGSGVNKLGSESGSLAVWTATSQVSIESVCVEIVSVAGVLSVARSVWVLL